LHFAGLSMVPICDRSHGLQYVARIAAWLLSY